MRKADRKDGGEREREDVTCNKDLKLDLNQGTWISLNGRSNVFFSVTLSLLNHLPIIFTNVLSV